MANSWSSYEINRKDVNGATIITTGGNVGNSNSWEKNEKLCRREGITTYCQHCHSPLIGEKNYQVNIWKDTNLAPMDYSDEYTKIVFMGPGCVRQFLDKDFIGTHATLISH